MSRNVTIYDIAKAAGVSPSTVSRALSKPGRMAIATEMKIHRVAEELGYLSHRRDGDGASPASGLILVMSSGFDNPYNMRILAALERGLERHGYAAVCSDFAMNYAIKRRATSLLMRDIDGVVLISPTINEPDLRRMTTNRPTVLVNQQLSGLSTIAVDSTAAIERTMRMLRDSGHASVTYITGTSNSWANEVRRRAIKAAAYRYDMELRVAHGGFQATVSGGEQAARQFMQHPTDAVFTYNDQLAIGFEAAMRARGMRIPDDVSLIGFDNDPAGAAALPALTTIDQHAETLGDMAARTIVELVRAPQSRRVNLIEQATLVERDSVSAGRRSVMKLGPYAMTRPDDAETSGTLTLTVLSATFTELMPRIEEFMRTHPGIVIDPIEGHTKQAANDLYWERLQSGRPVPDVFNLDIDVMPQFAASGAFMNLSTPRVETEWGAEFNPAAWSEAHHAGGLYGLPGDQAQTVLFYRRDLLDEYGIAVPRTYEEFHRSGVELHRREPSLYLGVMDTTMQYYLAFLRAAGLRPWRMDGPDHITFDLADPRIGEVASFLQRCLDDGVLVAQRTWDGRYATIRDGLVATVLNGNWYGKIIAASYPASAGRWRVALPPSWGAPDKLMTAEIGGSVMTVSARIPKDHQRAALEFAHWFQADPTSVDLRAIGGYSATRYFQTKPDLLDTVDPYFEQQVYRVYTESAHLVNRDWDYLPFDAFMSAGFASRVLPELRPGGGSPAAVRDWLAELPGYARSQGYRVTCSG
ncbi:Periplasmic binding protein-like domain-containing protein [Bifidobacterium sp. DSM 109958]|uniref:Periplasmic binding protein-like domain-containing protein n=1 Tax=Bifidobacterium moraviense TaxID=2675323 RepID=A0A7Y0F1P4_9BIFI|nr:extracellular solute-binding protein [Bifidobacterium sp. DSM 109958]NMN00376.1 Periplasmic binding protein-like domain-containing protein [Bifidobacterium sp. DSM 109958]